MATLGKMNDIELLRRYAENGSEEAFAELVRRHLNLVYSAALRRVGDDVHLARDVSQKVFVALARQASSLSGRQSLIGWLYTASRYAAAHVVRSEHRRKEREQRAYIMNEIFSAAPPDLEWEKVRPSLDRVMDQLNETDREALLLRFFSGRSFSEVGASLGLSEEAARKRVARALERLRALLARRGVSSASTAVAAMLAGHAVSAAPAGLAVTVSGVAVAAAAAAPAAGFLSWLGLAPGGLGTAGVLVLALGVSLPAAGFAVSKFGSARRAEAALAAAGREYAVQLAGLQAVEKSAAAADQAVAARALAPRDPGSRGRKFLAEFPEARAMLIELGMSGALRTNGSFYRLAGFTPAQIDRFQHLLVETWADNLAASPGASGLPSDDELRAVVGDDAFRKFQAFSQMIDAYRWTGEAAKELNYNGTPLSAEQTDRLAQILADNSAIYRSGHALNRSSVDGGTAMASVDWDGAMAESRTVLSAAQWRAVEPIFLNFQFQGAVARAQLTQSGAGLPATAGE